MEEKKTPDKGKLLLKSYAMSLLSLMLCVTMLVGTTYAWFTSDVTTGSNEIQVGTLKVDMQDADGNTLAGRQNLFGSGTAKWEPGATWFETVQVKNYGDLAFDYTLHFNTVGQEIANIDTVGKYIDVYVTTNGADCKNTEDILTKWVRVGTLADVVGHNMLLTSGSWIPDPEKENVCIVDTVSIALHMPTSFTGFDGKTDLMGKTLSGFGLRMTATQKIHETDGFGTGYDQGASTKLLAGTPAELAAAFQAGMDVKLTNNISLDADTTLTVNKGAKMVLDLNGFGISATSNTIGANRELFLVKGNLTVTDTAPATATVATAGAEPAIARGITYQHTGTNMEWNAMSTIFDVTAGGVLTLNNVKCENLGGTDMNFVAHLNNWGEASLYANNAYLKAPYCAIRVFNSGYDMNNVVATNSTIEAGNRALWVHNYIGDLNSAEHSDEAIQARLNINILNDTNTVIGQVRYGFNNPDVTAAVATAEDLQKVLNSASGTVKVTFSADITGNVSVAQKENTNVVIDGNGKKFTGVMTVFGAGRQTGAETLTIKNINFVAGAGAGSAIVSPDRSQNNAYSYSHNVTVQNCTFTDRDGEVNCAAIRQEDGGDKNWTVIGCTVDNTMHSIFQVNNVEGKLTVADCKVYSKNGANLNCSTNVEMTGCTFDVTGYAVRFGVSTGGNPGVAKNFVIKNSDLKSANDDGDAVIMFRASAVDASLTLENCTLTGNPDISGNTAATTIIKK